MATAPLPFVSVEEYLHTSYEPDVEYVDGVLVNRGIPTIAHSLLQKLLLLYFAPLEKSLSFEALQEVRTLIIGRARYRIPDLMLCPLPLPKGSVYDVVPWAVVEILSPDDTLTQTRARFFDYAQAGVKHLVLMDPEEYVAYRFQDGSLIQTVFEDLQFTSFSIPFRSAELFEQLRAKRAAVEAR